MRTFVALALFIAAGNAFAAAPPAKPNMSPDALARALQSVAKDSKAPSSTTSAPNGKESLVDIKNKAEAGDAKAQLAFAEEFLRMQKFASAEHWLRAAAVQGEPAALAALADLYENSHGSGTNLVKANPTNAVALYKLAAALGHTNSHLQVGLAYKTGTILRKDPVRAYAHLKLAPASSNRDQQVNQLIAEMSQDQINAAERIVLRFKPVKFDDAFADLVFETIHITGIFGDAEKRVAMVNGKEVNVGQQITLLVGGLNAQVKFAEISHDGAFVTFQSHERKIKLRSL